MTRTTIEPDNPTAQEPAPEPAADARAEAAVGSDPAASEDEVVVRVTGLGKKFKIYRHPWQRLGEWATGGRLKRHKEFWAVRGVSFELRRGECMGIIGANGSGKSTLLKMINNSLYPTEGGVQVKGRALSLIELGTGLNPQLTGRQNIVNMARLLDFPPSYAHKRMKEIESFAEIGEFFDRPTRLYSSGMRVRLTFSMYACFRPELLVIDEALSVGDVFFQQKCAARIRELTNEGMTLLFVSHDMSAVGNLCQRAVLLDKGKPAFQGDPKEAISRYFSRLGGSRPGSKWAEEKQQESRPSPGAAPEDDGILFTPKEIIARDVTAARREHRHGEGGVLIKAARITDQDGRDTRVFRVGTKMVVHVLLEAQRRVARPRAGIRLHDRLGNHVFGQGTAQHAHELPALEPGERLIVRFELTMNLRPNPYTFGLSTSEPVDENNPNSALFHDQLDLLGPVQVGAPADNHMPFFGIAKLPMRVGHKVVGKKGRRDRGTEGQSEEAAQSRSDGEAE